MDCVQPCCRRGVLAALLPEVDLPSGETSPDSDSADFSGYRERYPGSRAAVGDSGRRPAAVHGAFGSGMLASHVRVILNLHETDSVELGDGVCLGFFIVIPVVNFLNVIRAEHLHAGGARLGGYSY